MKHESDPFLIDRREAARLLDISIPKVVQLEEAGDLKRVDIGGSVKITVASLHELIERGGNHPPAPKGRRGRPRVKQEGGK